MEAPEKPKYWAALPLEELGSELVSRIQEYYRALRAAGLIELWRSSHAAFYGLSPTGGGLEVAHITEYGEQGEKLAVRSNQLRSLLRYMLNSATADRPSTVPKALNTTSAAMAQVPTARRIMEYYFTRRGLERQLKGTVLRSLLYGKGYLWQSWDPSLGTPGPEGKPEGDLIYRACSPLEVACDLERDSQDHDWLIIRRPRGKYDAAVVYGGADPELQDEIIDLEKDCLEPAIAGRLGFALQRRDEQESDLIYEYHFFHRRSPAMPEGRYAIMIGDGRVVFDGDLPYQDLPVSEMVPEEFLEAGSIGYASAWDLMGLQQAYDALLSTCLTNFDAFGQQDLMIPEGVELNSESVRDGLNVLRYPPGEHNRPFMLEKFALREEVFRLKDWLKSDLELNSGVNSVARGEPNSNLKSGSALALVQAQAIHFQSGLNEAYVHTIEDVETKSVRILKQYAKTPRLAAIAGANDPDGMKAFQASDIDQIDRIEVERVNPVFRTLAGKFDIANNLLDRGLIKEIGQYYQVLETGRLEAVTDNDRKCAQQIQAENEILMTGPAVSQTLDEMGQPKFTVEGVRAIWTDNPVKHMMGHAAVLDSAEVRANEAAVAAVTYHMQEHLQAWRMAPKDALALFGYPMPPMLPGDPMEMQAPAPSEQGSKPIAKPAASAGEQAGQDAPDEGSGMPSLPSPAKNPMENVQE